MRLTKRILNAIVTMAGYLEAEGTDGCQGCANDLERQKLFNACMDASDWAAQELARRERAKQIKPKPPPPPPDDDRETIAPGDERYYRPADATEP